jgi:2'-hydroxyisoflavone reductase
VTLFNRGETNPELFPEAEKIRGDRATDLDALAGRSWDAAVDTSGYLPHVVRASAEALAGSVEHYVFISSISAYGDQSGPNDEDSAAAELGDMPVDELVLNDDGGNYGALKALCEQAVTEVLAGRHANIRPGLIVGAHDPTGRFTYWPHRVARGGDVLAPAPPEREIQFVDVRDLAAWILGVAERRVTGTFNATHPGRPWGELLETARRTAGGDAALTWVSDDFLTAHEVGEWMELPMWIQDPEWVGMHMADVTKALEAGLTFRPLEQTVRETLELAEPTDEAGLSPEREVELLQAWAARR